MKDLSFDDLQLFARVAALRTLSAVARERQVPVSGVSRTLARIEAACGAKLVRRSTHGMTLTPEGESFLAWCTRIGGTVDEMEAEFADRTARVSGLVKLSVSTVMAQYWIVPALPSLQARHPDLQVELRVNDRLVDIVREGIDIAIRTGEVAGEAMVLRPMGTLGTALYASPGYLAAHGTPHAPEDLGTHRLLANCSYPVLNRWHFANGHTLIAQGPTQADNTAVIVTMALHGLGIARLPTLVGAPLVQAGQLVPVLPGALQVEPMQVHAVMLAERQRLPRMRACIEHFCEWFARSS